MAEVVGIRFKRAGRVYYFDPADNELQVNDQVVVKTARGLELGCVVDLDTKSDRPVKNIADKSSTPPIELRMLAF